MVVKQIFMVQLPPYWLKQQEWESKILLCGLDYSPPDIENENCYNIVGLGHSVAKEKPILGYPLAFDHPGSLTAEAKHGEISLCRFDGDNANTICCWTAKGVDGPRAWVLIFG